MVASVRIAVLITCHNRKVLTLECLEALYAQSARSACSLSVFLVDDGGTDGTADAVRRSFPDVTLLTGTGTLYWNGGMRTAYAAASRADHDYHLWLNDDTMLHPGALDLLLHTAHDVSEDHARPVIVAGSTRDPRDGALTSGGYRFRPPRLFFRFRLVEPSDAPLPCDTMAGNCVLIPRAVARSLGNLNPAFTHYLGDFDYGLRARKRGVALWVAPGTVGSCSSNARRDNQVSSSPHLADALQLLRHPKGLSLGPSEHHRLLPMDEWTTFLRLHAGPLWPIPWMLTYGKLAGPLARRLWRR